MLSPGVKLLSWHHVITPTRNASKIGKQEIYYRRRLTLFTLRPRWSLSVKCRTAPQHSNPQVSFAFTPPLLTFDKRSSVKIAHFGILNQSKLLQIQSLQVFWSHILSYQWFEADLINTFCIEIEIIQSLTDCPKISIVIPNQLSDPVNEFQFS